MLLRGNDHVHDAMAELTTAEFLQQFDAKVSLARSRINAAETAADVDSVCFAIDALHVDLSAAVYDLAAYDVRRAQEALGAVAAERQVKSEKLSPPMPFRFRHRRQLPPAATTSADARASAETQTSGGSATAQKAPLAVSGESSKVVTIANETGSDGRSCRTFGPGSIRFRDVSLSRLSGMTVMLADTAGAVRGVDLDNCTIRIGPVAGSVHLTNCKHCDIYVAARQVRIHASSDCSFFVLARSAPIIEDCKELRFAPYALRYDALHDQLEEADLPSLSASMEGLIGDVKDFSWLQEGQSPNWSVVPIEARPSDTVLTL